MYNSLTVNYSTYPVSFLVRPPQTRLYLRHQTIPALLLSFRCTCTLTSAKTYNKDSHIRDRSPFPLLVHPTRYLRMPWIQYNLVGVQKYITDYRSLSGTGLSISVRSGSEPTTNYDTTFVNPFDVHLPPRTTEVVVSIDETPKMSTTGPEVPGRRRGT